MFVTSFLPCLSVLGTAILHAAAERPLLDRSQVQVENDGVSSDTWFQSAMMDITDTDTSMAELERARSDLSRSWQESIVRIDASSVHARTLPALPKGAPTNLFVPTLNKCNQTRRAEFIKRFPKQFAVSERQKGTEASLKKLHDVFSSFSIPVIIEAGSMLGFYRQCSVIPSDMDGDTAILAHWLRGDDEPYDPKRPNRAELGEAFKKKGGYLATSLCPDGPTSTGCEMRAWFNNFYIDIFVYSTHHKCEKAPCTFGTSLWPGGVVGPEYRECKVPNVHFELADFLERKFWIPSPTVDYIIANYGKDWQAPGGGVYKTCDFQHTVKTGPDTFGRTMPPADYVYEMSK